MWEKRRNHKGLYLLLFVLGWAVLVSGVGTLFVTILHGEELLWSILAPYAFGGVVAGLFMGLHTFKLREKKYQKVLAWEAANK